MSAPENPKVRFADPKRTLKAAEIDFMKLIEQQNVERVLKLKKTRKNNLLTAVCVTCMRFAPLLPNNIHKLLK